MIGDSAGFYVGLSFQHIPTPEFRNPNIRIGKQRELLETSRYNSGYYTALTEERVVTLCCGYDHVNDFCAELTSLEGPWLCYASASGYGGYCSYDGVRFCRGMRILEINANEETLKTWMRKEHAENRADELTLVPRARG